MTSVRGHVADATGASVLDFRGLLAGIASLAAHECRDVVVLAVDGLTVAAAAEHLSATSAQVIETVFPTSSFPGWLSSLTGIAVAEHGIPGPMFRNYRSCGVVNLLEDRGHHLSRVYETVFTDARQRGLEPFALVNDMACWSGGVTSAMLRGARTVAGRLYFRNDGPLAAAPDGVALRKDVWRILGHRPRPPRLVWVFVELDHHIHVHGYDDWVRRWLEHIQTLADDLAAQDCYVVLHSDHGLVPTRHVPTLAAGLSDIARRLCTTAGGAGRTRWFDARSSSVDVLVSKLDSLFGDCAQVCSRDDVFPVNTPGWRSLGEVVVIAGQTDFVTPACARYEHGSAQPDEVAVPLLMWTPP